VVNFPRDKRHLLPDNFVIKDLDEAMLTEDSVVLVDEGTTFLPVIFCRSIASDRAKLR